MFNKKGPILLYKNKIVSESYFSGRKFAAFNSHKLDESRCLEPTVGIWSRINLHVKFVEITFNHALLQHISVTIV